MIARRDVFFAIADEQILMMLAKEKQPMSINTIANGFDITRAGVSKHIKILSESGLVTTAYAGREHFVSLQATQLAEVHEWVTVFEEFWHAKLSVLKTMVESKTKKK